MAEKNVDKNVDVATFLDDLRELAVVVGEDCPEGHRKDPGSGRCLPMGSIDHTEFTRSKNVDYGPEWRGEVDKKDTTPMIANDQETAIDAEDMDEPQSCAEGMTFSFIQRRCVSLEEAETENSDEFAMTEEGSYVEDARNGHEEIVSLDPSGRRDTINFECPTNQFFDRKLRLCIPLNKDTVLASEDFSDEFKKEVATYARLAMTPPDHMDGHRHVAVLDEDGNGQTSMAGYGDRAHHHMIKKFVVQDNAMASEEGESYTSKHPGVAVPEEHRIEKLDDYADTVEAVPAPSVGTESAAPLKGGQRSALPDSAFGVPGKRKFPLDTCARVRNAMARFNQGKGLTSGEKASLRRKILARAKACSIEVQNFGKADTVEEFAAVVQELITMDKKTTEDRIETYRAEAQGQGPCPPGMNWDSAALRCNKVSGFVKEIAANGHEQVISNQPSGRKDTVGYNCPAGEFFDFSNRRCVPLDPSRKPGSTTDKAAERDLTAQPEGRPVRLPIDCPKDTIWNKDRNECIPLDSSKKTKSAEDEEAALPDFIKKIQEKKKNGKDGDDKNGKKKKKGFVPFTKKSKSEEDEDAQTTAVGPGNKGGPGCPEGQFMNPVTKKCMPRKGAFKGSEQEDADANPSMREGLTPPPAGKVQHQSDCPPNTAWDAKSKVCRPIDSMDKNRPSGASPQNPNSVAEELTTAQIIQALDEIIKGLGEQEKSKVLAKELPNAAFPPSLVSDSHRSLMHHKSDVVDPYDTASVDVARLRNSLFRATSVKGFSDKAVDDAIDHLLFHAREIVVEAAGKKS